MISLHGLTLATGRANDAAGILRTFAGYVDQGLLPNTFPDSASTLPGYNTADATLWYVLAIAAYDRATDDVSLADELLPGLRSIVEWLDGAEAAAVVDAVGRALAAGMGLRSLDPDDRDYRGDYGGDQVRRDGSHHQGPVWTWLLGPYAEAHFRVHGDRAVTLALLEPVEHHLRDACLGSVSEILEGDAPHMPVGCIAQAWGVAETLRVWRSLLQGREKRAP